MTNDYRDAREAASFIRSRTDLEPRSAVVLGTGLRGLVDRMEGAEEIPFGEIPHFPETTNEMHPGRLLAGRLAGRATIVLDGRFHRYEGFSMQEIAFPVRVLRAMGVERVILTGACGGLDPLWGLGDLVVLDDHINLLGDSPLIGPNDEALGPRFVDMIEPYDRELRLLAERAAREHDVPIRTGVYAAVTGPALSTRAEYRMLRTLGADVVGMSTAPETLAAVHGGMKVLALCIVTDLCMPDALGPIDIPRILETAAAAEPGLTAVVEQVIGAGSPDDDRRPAEA